MKKKSISVILPTYNESKNIDILVSDLINQCENFNLIYEIIIVDDFSPDKTWEVAQRIQRENNKVKTIIRKVERGLASAIRTGIDNSINSIICIMDTDLSHPPKDIIRMLEFSDSYDMVWASRYVSGGQMKALGKKRIQRWFSYIFNQYLKFILQIPILDCTNGFFITNRNVFNLVELNKVFNGYGDFAFKLLYKLKGKNISMLEIPFTYEERKYGESKTGIFKISIKYFIESLKLLMGK